MDAARRRASPTRVVAAFETIEGAVSRPSETGEACVGLKTYMKFLPAELDALKAAIAQNAARDEFLDEYFSDQSDEDLNLSVLAKGWPLKCKAVLLRASVTVEKEYKVFEKQVKARRVAFAEALEARTKEIAEFRVLGDVVEREAIATKVDALAEAIDRATTESQEINAEERRSLLSAHQARTENQRADFVAGPVQEAVYYSPTCSATTGTGSPGRSPRSFRKRWTRRCRTPTA